MTELSSARLFINPAANRWRAKKLAPKIRNYLQQRGLKSKAVFSRDKGDITKLVKQAVLDGTRTIIVAGGDGTIFEGVNGIMQARELLSDAVWNELQPTLGILPVGTGNDFIKAAKIPKELQEACDHLLEATAKSIDVAYLETHEGEKSYFINNVGTGFDGRIAATATRIPVVKGFAVYALAIIWHLIKGVPNPNIQVNVDGKTINKKMTLAVVSNGTSYGGAFAIAPDAKLDDGKLDFILCPARGRITILPLFQKLISAKHLHDPNIDFAQIENFSIQSDEEITIVADGEIISESSLGFKVQVLKNQFNLIGKS